MNRRHFASETRSWAILGVVFCLMSGVLLRAEDSYAQGAETAQTEFFRQTLQDAPDLRDNLARGFNPVQLPLIAAALEADSPGGLDRHEIYRALARWHFWEGRRWDKITDGFWQVESSSVPVGAAHESRTLAAHASLELIELAALARFASEHGHNFDAITWWTDYDRLRRRLSERLFDPSVGAYADLDSIQAPMRTRGVSSLLPLAFGARSAGPLSRRAAWRLWTDEDPPQNDVSAAGLMIAMDRADGFHGWSSDTGLRLFDPSVSASLSLWALRSIQDRELSTLVRRSFKTVGIAAADSIQLHVGAWSPTLNLETLSPRPFERTRVALSFLQEAGVLNAALVDSFVTGLDELPGPSPALERTWVKRLTTLLVELRGQNVRDNRFAWQARRRKLGTEDSKPGSILHFEWSDTSVWHTKCLDLLLADILDARTQPEQGSRWKATFEPQVAGRGDSVELVLRCSIPSEVESFAADTLSVIWSDGTRVVAGAPIVLEQTDAKTLVGFIGSPPSDLGLWTAILDGGPSPMRRPPVLPVVRALRADIGPVRRNGRDVTFRARVDSHVQMTQRGRVDLELPINWNVDPGASAEFEIDGTKHAELDFSLSPDKDASPGLYRIRWHLYDHQNEVELIESAVSIPFAWLYLGALNADREKLADTPQSTDRQVDLAERFRGPTGAVGWTRMPAHAVGADGWVELASPSDPLGTHYAYTAFTTNSRESVVRVETSCSAIISVNGSSVGRIDRWGGDKTFETTFHSGINHLLIKLVGGGGRDARFRLDVRDIDSSHLRAVSNSLENLLDAYAYLKRTETGEENPEQDRQELRLVPITYTNAAASRVAVVGSFNGWSPNATPMTPLGDGRFQAKIRVRPGRFEYKIAVDGDRWIADPNNPEAVSDGFGGRNSVLVVE